MVARNECTCKSMFGERFIDKGIQVVQDDVDTIDPLHIMGCSQYGGQNKRHFLF